MDYMKQDKQFRYKKCGLDEAMNRANGYIQELRETHKKKFTDDMLYKKVSNINML